MEYIKTVDNLGLVCQCVWWSESEASEKRSILASGHKIYNEEF